MEWGFHVNSFTLFVLLLNVSHKLYVWAPRYLDTLVVVNLLMFLEPKKQNNKKKTTSLLNCSLSRYILKGTGFILIFPEDGNKWHQFMKEQES